MPKVKMHVYTNALEGKDAEFNEWYNTIHIPEVLQLSNAVAAQRFRLTDADSNASETHRYLAIYEFEVDSQEALDSVVKNTDKMNMGSSLDLSGAKIIFFEDIAERVVAAQTT